MRNLTPAWPVLASFVIHAACGATRPRDPATAAQALIAELDTPARARALIDVARGVATYESSLDPGAPGRTDRKCGRDAFDLLLELRAQLREGREVRCAPLRDGERCVLRRREPGDPQYELTFERVDSGRRLRVSQRAHDDSPLPDAAVTAAAAGPPCPPILEADEITASARGKTTLAIHRDGTTEVDGEPGPRIEPGGVLSFRGAPAARVAIDGAILDPRTGEPLPFSLAGDLLMARARGTEVSVRLTADGTLMIPGAAPVRVLGADTLAKRHAVLAVLALTLGLATRSP